MKTALIYCAHRISPVLTRELRRLEREIPKDFSLFIAGLCDHNNTLSPIASERTKTRSYTRDDLRQLPYSERIRTTNWETMRGSNDLALLKFFKDNPSFDNYWFIEYDVRYTSNWGNFFAEFDGCKADLLGVQIFRCAANPNWPHWAGLRKDNNPVPDDIKTSAFLPLCRASRRLLEAIDTACSTGWSGHPEALWPTIATLNKMSIEEIGGNSTFTPDARRKKYYGFAEIPAVGLIGNFIAWPSFKDTNDFIYQKPDALWHPVKD